MAFFLNKFLESCKDWIDGIVISDTGSKDNTIDLILQWKKENGKLGVVVRHDWVNFEHNRNKALESCLSWLYGQPTYKENSNNYVIFMDADDQLAIEDKSKFAQQLNDMKLEKYMINIRNEYITYGRWFAIKAPKQKETCTCHWVGVVHECIEREGKDGYLFNAYIHERREGARSADPMKYLRDALLLEADLKKNPENARSVFYLAQSYRDYGGPLFKRMAEKLYLKRAVMKTGWSEEVYVSLIEAAKCREIRGKNDSRVIELYTRAFNVNPKRLEAPYFLIKHNRIQGNQIFGYTFGKSLLHLQPSTTFLFVDQSIYDWKFADEVAVCATWAGDKDLYRTLCKLLLQNNKVPNDQKDRIDKEFAKFG